MAAAAAAKVKAVAAVAMAKVSTAVATTTKRTTSPINTQLIWIHRRHDRRQLGLREGEREKVNHERRESQLLTSDRPTDTFRLGGGINGRLSGAVGRLVTRRLTSGPSLS
jgi:hypothetical protein